MGTKRMLERKTAVNGNLLVLIEEDFTRICPYFFYAILKGLTFQIFDIRLLLKFGD